MKLTLGFSTCPNDTFIFDAMIHGKIDTGGLSFDVIMADVEELNHLAFHREIHITKLSYHAFAMVADHYCLLHAGSALGRKNGPLVIGRNDTGTVLPPDATVAIPGKFTTANLLFAIFFPSLQHKKEYLFSDIEDAILRREADAGVIIHENRFTYQNKGLNKIADLGEMWEAKTGLPIPLGGIVADRNLPAAVYRTLDRVMKNSVLYAMQNPDSSLGFVKEHAQELNDEVIRKHISLYVNDFTVDLSEEGRKAIDILLLEALEKKVIDKIPEKYFK